MRDLRALSDTELAQLMVDARARYDDALHQLRMAQDDIETITDEQARRKERQHHRP